MSEIQNLSLADTLALVKQAQAALKVMQEQRSQEFSEVIRSAVEDVILTQGDPQTSEKSGWTGYSERTTVMVDGVSYGVSVTITHTQKSEAAKAAIKAAEKQAAKA